MLILGRAAARPSVPAAGRPLRFIAVVLSFTVAAAGCAAKSFVRPSGPAVPMTAAEADAIWQEATRTCADVRVFNAEVRPSGRIAGSRVRGVTLFVAVTADGEIGIEAVAASQTHFVLKGTADRATLLLPRENRVVTAPAAEILDALVGLDADPRRLLAVFSGCIAIDRRAERAERLGEIVRITTPNSIVFARRDESAWRTIAGESGELTVDYRRFAEGRPSEIGLRTAEGRTPSVNLSLSVRDVRINLTLQPSAFTVVVPPGAVPAAVADLRPLGSTD